MQSIGVGVNFMRDRGISLEFTKTFTVNRNENTRNTRRVIICVKLDETNLSEGEQIRFQVCIEEFKQVFSDKPELTDVTWDEIITGDIAPVATKSYRYDQVKQSIIDYHT